jgi:hypothetical protein
MTPWAALVLIPLGVAAARVAGLDMAMPGVPNPERASQNWMLECQGCHRPDATGTPETAPAINGVIATFLSVPGGRHYLAQVPGVATAALPDDQLAELLNWTLQHFDPVHVPTNFQPYTPREMAQLRHTPLRIEAAALRRRLVAQIESRNDHNSAKPRGDGLK